MKSRQHLSMLAIIGLAALAACKAEPDFDARYEQARAGVARQAEEIDQELSRRTAAVPAATESPPSAN